MGATSDSSVQGAVESRVAARSKEAGALVYLMEELGDARMRCDQLLRYVDKATKLVEKSSHKDHFFEVAGDLIRGIPETSFKLHKALQAVALAANRIDYEEIKQDLRPEKAEELERVLKDVRVRQVQRRSLPMLNPANVVEQLRGLAKQAREGGRLDTEGLGTLIAALESGAPKVADDVGERAAAQLEAMAHALENPPAGEMPSRVRLAQVLRKTYAEHIDVSASASDEKQSRYEEGKSADPTENMSKDDAKAWKENTEEYGDKFKKEAKGTEMLLPPPGLPAFAPEIAAPSVEGAIDSLKQLLRMLTASSHVRPGSINHAFKAAIVELSAAAWNLNMPDLSALLEKTKRNVRVKSIDKLAAEEAQPRDIQELEAALESLLANARITRTFGTQGNYKKVLFNLMKVIGDVYTVTNIFDIPGTGFLARVIKAIVPYSGARPMLNFSASVETDEKLSRFEEGKSADPTENMSEEDAKAWKENTEEYGDKFKAAAWKVAKKIPAPDDGSIVNEIMNWHGGQGTNLYSVGSTWNSGRDVDADDAEEAYDELKRKRADRDALEAFEEHLSQHGVKVAGLDAKAFGSRGRVYLHYVKGGTKRREGPLDPQLAKRRMVALMEDGSVSEADFERKASTARTPTDEDWKAA